MPYRDDLAAALARSASLERELRAAQLDRAELEAARARLREAELEVEDLRSRLGISARPRRSTLAATIAVALVVLPAACVAWSGLIDWIDPWGVSLGPGLYVGLAVGAATGGSIGLVRQVLGRRHALLIWCASGAAVGGFFGVVFRILAGIGGG